MCLRRRWHWEVARVPPSRSSAGNQQRTPADAAGFSIINRFAVASEWKQARGFETGGLITKEA